MTQANHIDWPAKAVEQQAASAICLECNTAWGKENLAYARQHVKEKKHHVCFESETVKA